jgi:hypothetical protein
MENPRVYYRMDNFYANHRKFVKSRSYSQLRGQVITAGGASGCDPAITMSSMDTKTTLGSKTLTDADVANPCGLIAKYYFTGKSIFNLDTFEIKDSQGNKLDINESNIAHSVDRDYKFRLPKDSADLVWKNYEDEHVMVWYQMESFPNFIKLWGYIRKTIEPGTYTVTIPNNNYDVSNWDGKKYIYLSTVNDLGGTNDFLGIAFLTMGGIVAFIMIVFVVLKLVKGKDEELYSIDNMSW